MQPKVRVSSVNIRQHAVRKRTASEAGPSRPSKKDRAAVSTSSRAAVSTSSQATASTSAEEPDVPSASVPEPILALSARTALPTASSEDGAVREGAAVATLVAPPTEDVRAEVEVAAEPEQSATAPIAVHCKKCACSFGPRTSCGVSARRRRGAMGGLRYGAGLAGARQRGGLWGRAMGLPVSLPPVRGGSPS